MDENSCPAHSISCVRWESPLKALLLPGGDLLILAPFALGLHKALIGSLPNGSLEDGDTVWLGTQGIPRTQSWTNGNGTMPGLDQVLHVSLVHPRSSYFLGDRVVEVRSDAF